MGDDRLGDGFWRAGSLFGLWRARTGGGSFCGGVDNRDGAGFPLTHFSISVQDLRVDRFASLDGDLGKASGGRVEAGLLNGGSSDDQAVSLDSAAKIGRIVMRVGSIVPMNLVVGKASVEKL